VYKLSNEREYKQKVTAYLYTCVSPDTHNGELNPVQTHVSMRQDDCLEPGPSTRWPPITNKNYLYTYPILKKSVGMSRSEVTYRPANQNF